MAKRQAKFLEKNTELELLSEFQETGSQSAMDRLVAAYAPLVNKMAHAYARRGSCNIQDLLQQANFGLIEAIHAYRPDFNSRLSTLASHYIKARLMRYVMDFSSAVRIGTNLPDKRAYTRLRPMISEIQAKNGYRPITDADRQTIAEKLGVRLEVVQRMEARIYANDVSIVAENSSDQDEDDKRSASHCVEALSVEGGQYEVDCRTDQARIMARIRTVVEQNFSGRDVEIIQSRLAGNMTPEKYAALTDRYGITVERVRQIQRGALAMIRQALEADGITSVSDIAM